MIFLNKNFLRSKYVLIWQSLRKLHILPKLARRTFRHLKTRFYKLPKTSLHFLVAKLIRYPVGRQVVKKWLQTRKFIRAKVPRRLRLSAGWVVIGFIVLVCWRLATLPTYVLSSADIKLNRPGQYCAYDQG